MSGPVARPPRLARWILRRRTGRDTVGETIRGDLWQEYVERRGRHGRFRAASWYWREVLGVRRPGRFRALVSAGRQDIRYAARNLRRAPGFVVVVVALAGLGIGSTTTIYTAINALFFRPPPLVVAPERLVAVYTSDSSGPRYGVNSWANFLAVRERVDAFESAAAYRLGDQLKVGTQEGTRPLFAVSVSAEYFDLLGVEPWRGRWFADSEVGAAAVAESLVLGYSTWQQSFGGDPEIVGREIRVDGRMRTVIGIAPAGLLTPGFPVAVAAYQPLTGDELADRGSRSLSILGRLRGDATLEAAQAQLDGLAQSLFEQEPGTFSNRDGEPRRLTGVAEFDARLSPDARTAAAAFLALLLGAGGVVLLIACSNIANLLLVRGADRGGELAIRRAMGAGRGRLVQMLLAESLLLAAGGGLVGVTITFWVSRLLPRSGFAPVGLELDFTPDLRVVLFAVATSLLTGALFGLLPARRAVRPDLSTTLRGDADAVAGGRSRLRDGLVVVQVCGSVALLALAGLFLRSIDNSTRVDVGFDPRGVAVVEIDATSLDLGRDEALALYGDAADRLRAAPQVEAVAYSWRVPLSGGSVRTLVDIDGYTPPDGRTPEVSVNVVSPGYFELMRIELVRGRTFDDTDRVGAAGAAIVNEAFVRSYLPDDGLGGRIDNGSGDFTIVGVVVDTRVRELMEEPVPQMWMPLAQSWRPQVLLHVRARRPDDASVYELIRTTFAEARGDLSLVSPAWMTEMMQNATLPQRIASGVIGAAGFLALLLAGAGLYGVVAFAVHRRGREIGIRMALGASRTAVVSSVLRRTLVLTALGALAGTAIAILAGFALRSLLVGTSPVDPIALGVAVACLGAAAGVAAVGPARRATRVQPARALRTD